MTNRWTAALLALPLVLGVAACGDDDDSEEGASASASEEAAGDEGDGGNTCRTWLDITAAFNGEPTIEQMDPLFDDLTANAPEEIADDVEFATTTAREVLETGNFDLFETPEMGKALANADGYHFETCEADEKIDITAVDYAFTGLPEELDAGTVFLKMTNGTTHGEAHEIGIVRKQDGVTETWDEILALGEDESESKIEFVGGGFAGAEGDVGYVFLEDLAPGEYLAACFIPVGGEDDGAPHFTQGMKHEFTVS